MSRESRRTLLVVLSLLVIVGAGYWWGRHWMAGQVTGAAPIELEVAGECALHRGPCEFVLPAGVVRVEFSEEPVPLRPFRVQLYAPAIDIDAVSADFQMVDMYMGVNRYSLTRQSREVWSREAMLPVCAVGRSDWRMHTRLDVGDQTYLVILPFEAAAAR